MVIHPRQRRLLELVRQRSSMTVEDLAASLEVTPQTVRRDIRTLASARLLARYHGGVGLPSSVQNVAYLQRQAMHADGKSRIARAVAERLPHDCSVILNIGTTTEAVAAALVRHTGLRVVTNNLNVAATLSDNPACEVLVAGGVVRTHDRGIVGEATVGFIEQFRVDVAIIGISGIDDDGTLRDFDAREVKVSQTIIEHAREVWLVADRSKFGRHAFVRQADLRQVDVLFTDEPPPARFASVIREAGCELVIAAAGGDGSP
jgi:DeoR family glycerol-3-phosphate regulon repressor